MPIEIEASCYDELDLTDTDFMVSIRTGDGVKFTPREDKIDDDRPTSPKASKPKSPVVRKTQAAAAAERRSEAHVKRGPKKRQRKHPPYLPQGSMDSVLNLTAVKVKTDKDTGVTTAMRIERKKRKNFGGGGGSSNNNQVTFGEPATQEGFYAVGESRHALYVNALREEAKTAKASVLKDRTGFELMSAHIRRAESRVKVLQSGHNLDLELTPRTPVEVGLWVQQHAAQIERSPLMTMCLVHGITPPASLVARERERERKEGGGGGGWGKKKKKKKKNDKDDDDDDDDDDNGSMDTQARQRAKKEKARLSRPPLGERLDMAIQLARRDRFRGDGGLDVNSSRLSNSSRASSRQGSRAGSRQGARRPSGKGGKLVQGQAMPPSFRRPSNVGGRAAVVAANAAAAAAKQQQQQQQQQEERTAAEVVAALASAAGAGGGKDDDDGHRHGHGHGKGGAGGGGAMAMAPSRGAPPSASELMREMVETRDGTYGKMRGLCERVHGFRRGRLMKDACLQKDLEVKEFSWAKGMKLRNDCYDGPGGFDDDVDPYKLIQSPQFWQRTAAMTMQQIDKTAEGYVAHAQKDHVNSNRWFREALKKTVESATSATYPPLVSFLFAVHYVLVLEGAPLTEDIFFALLRPAFDSDDYKGVVLKVVRVFTEKLEISTEALVKWMKSVGLKPTQQLSFQATGGRRMTSHAGAGNKGGAGGVSTAASLEAFRAKRFGPNAGGPNASNGLAAMREEDEDDDDDDDDEEEEEEEEEE